MKLISIFLIILPLFNCHNVHKHYKSERTTVSKFEQQDNDAKFDHDALFGSNDILGSSSSSQLEPEEAKRRLEQFIVNGKLDRDEDGFITKSELSDWVASSFKQLSIQDALDQLKEEDIENSDGQISWSEHFKNNFNLGAEQNADEKQMIYEDRELFSAADLNMDGYLDLHEFPLFTSPEEHSEMHDTLYKLTMRRRDLNQDGLLDFHEYIVSEKGEQPDRTSEGYLIDKDKYENDLDKNKDGLLQKDEVLSWIIPNSNEIASEEAEHLISACDDNKDGKLTLNEIVNNYDIFLESEITEYGDKLVKHDEL